MPKADHKKNNFDIDLDFGKKGEDWVIQLFEGNEKIEVKTERGLWKETGNIAIEVKYKGKPSGLSTTEANMWIHLFEDNREIVGGFIIPVKTLKKRIKELYEAKEVSIVKGGDGNESLIALLPISKVFTNSLRF